MNEKEIFVQTLHNALHHAGHCFDATVYERMFAYFDHMVQVNRVMNLTGITDPREAALRHFADALNAPALAALQGRQTVVDIGTGAGLPGMPLAIACPGQHFVLVDSLHKRIAFLQQVKDLLQLDNVTLVCARAEDYARKCPAAADAALSRGVAPLRVVAEYCLPALRVGGVMLAWKGPAAPDELQQAQHALQVLGGDAGALHPYRPAEGVALNLVQVQKLRPTPKGYPRQAGTPGRKPL